MTRLKMTHSIPSGLALTLHDLSYGLLAPCSLRIEPGEIVCLSGSSGSGKSRLLRAIADLDPHTGEVYLGEYPQTTTPAHCWRQWVMLVPADSQWWADTVSEHFQQPSMADVQDLGFDSEVLNWPVSRLSSGEKQRLALLRALSYQPRALLLDEPTANLDGETCVQVEAWLSERAKNTALPVLWVAHNPAQIERVADQHWQIVGQQLERVR